MEGFSKLDSYREVRRSILSARCEPLSPVLNGSKWTWQLFERFNDTMFGTLLRPTDFFRRKNDKRGIFRELKVGQLNSGFFIIFLKKRINNKLLFYFHTRRMMREIVVDLGPRDD